MRDGIKSGAVLVAFGGRAEWWWARFLKPGFRHCFIALCPGSCWIILDPLSHQMEIRLEVVGREFDLARWYRRHGLVVVETVLGEAPKKIAPAMIFSCVEMAKRILGIHRRFILTPWQLYKYLEKEKEK